MAASDELEPNLDAELDSLVLDEDFIQAGRRELTAEERSDQLARIGRANDDLRRQGEISDGMGKPSSRRVRKAIPWVLLGAVVGGGIVLVAVLAR